MSSILVSGMIAETPGQGGATWAVLQYLLGLRRLGYDVHLIEPVSDLNRSAPWCRSVMESHGLGGSWTLLGPDGTAAGVTGRALDLVVERSDVLLNVAGMLRTEAILSKVPIRVYLDLDPAFVQLWHVAEGLDMRFAHHTHFVTISDAVGRTIPDCGRTWTATLPPVVLEAWPYAEELVHDGYTTVANWRGYGSIEHEGVHYGQKAHSLRPLFDLPRRVPERFALALHIHPDEARDLEALAENGWDLLDPAAVTATPQHYRRFISGSRGELGIAKSGYVVSDSGWFSDRSSCYLASGRPVVAQETGFSRRLPVGAGLFAFRDSTDVVEAAARIREDEAAQRAAARAVAEEHLDSDLVLSSLLAQVGI